MSEKHNLPGPAYPNVPASPPYPQQQMQYPQPPQGYPPAPPGAPPPYSAAPPPGYHNYPQQPFVPGYAVPQAPQPGMGMPMQPGQYYGPAPPPHMYSNPASTTVVVQGMYDAGARFDGMAQPNIPPPPPGCAPNVAQMAAMQGHQVQGTQKKSNFFTDGSGGGASWW